MDETWEEKLPDNAPKENYLRNLFLRVKEIKDINEWDEQLKKDKEVKKKKERPFPGCSG
jgi:ABC-type sulfate transport system substrate-binding protein